MSFPLNQFPDYPPPDPLLGQIQDLQSELLLGAVVLLGVSVFLRGGKLRRGTREDKRQKIQKQIKSLERQIDELKDKL